METKKKKYLLIPAAGSGTRLNTKTPKQYQKLAGKTVLRHTLEVFIKMNLFDGISVIINKDHKSLYENAIKGLELLPPIYGGQERKDSVYNGIMSFPDISDKDIILIHDAARLFIQEKEVKALLEAMTHEVAATLATPVTDTLKNEKGQTIDRNGLWALQTPQAFEYSTIKKAHEEEQTKNIENVTDDTALVSAMGINVAFIRSTPQNFKITTEEDWILAKQKMEIMQTKTRIGSGFDVHAFETNKNEQGFIKLCGVEIQHPFKLKGHSDADVGLHAITDALYGSIAAGDIGDHFPPSNQAYKNMDSTIFLEDAANKIKENNGIIENIDVTLICEDPKIGPFKDQMRDKIASLLSIQEDQVSVKATTTEKLGFAGRKEGIAAQAMACIKLIN